MKKRRCIAIAAFSALGLSGSAFAQLKPESAVNVDLSNLRADIAKRINVDTSQVPMILKLPAGVAARVCGMDADVLALHDKAGTPTCQAKNKSQALNEQVQRLTVAQR